MIELWTTVWLASSDPICAAGGTDVIGGLTGLIGIGKYLLTAAFFFAAGIWLFTEFLREGQTGSFKMSSFLIHNYMPLFILMLSAALLFGFSASDLMGGRGSPC